MTKSRSKVVKNLRLYRKIHKWTGLITFVCFVFIGLTGILLGWKKNSSGYILPNTITGISNNSAEFKSIDELTKVAVKSINEFTDNDNKLSRLDIRPSKGIVKATFKNSYYGVQIDAKTGEVLQIAKRNSDLLENIHDGSYLDNLFGTKSGFFKLIYTTITGLSLLVFCFTGFWLWYGPKRIKKMR